jgi:dipeptidase E
VASKIGDEIIETGLGYVDFLIEPHINSEYFPELTFDYVKKESGVLKHPIYGIDDNTAVKVDGDEVTVVSEGSWQKFDN